MNAIYDQITKDLGINKTFRDRPEAFEQFAKIVATQEAPRIATASVAPDNMEKGIAQYKQNIFSAVLNQPGSSL
jgi:CO dehydrogenase/acetyl-CoA synthase epsilon subunit